MTSAVVCPQSDWAENLPGGDCGYGPSYLPHPQVMAFSSISAQVCDMSQKYCFSPWPVCLYFSQTTTLYKLLCRAKCRIELFGFFCFCFVFLLHLTWQLQQSWKYMYRSVLQKSEYNWEKCGLTLLTWVWFLGFSFFFFLFLWRLPSS